MNKNILFVFEFISGGGFNKINIPSSLFCEGFGMLRSIISDFKELGFEISTILDYRASFLTKFLQADIIRTVNEKDNYLLLVKKSLEECSYCFIIAPESSDTLYNLTMFVKKSNKVLLSTSLECISQSTPKIRSFKFFSNYKIPSPRTYKIPFTKKKLDVDFILQKFKNLECSIVIKPEDGVGAESIYYFEREDEIINFFRDFDQKSILNRDFILQEFIPGRDLSASLIGVPYIMDSQIKNPLLLSINAQIVDIKNSNYHSEYYGGYTPIENYQKTMNNLSLMLEKINFSGFSGYFGIDFIRTIDSKLYFIEINPRLTVSYLGLRNVFSQNLAKIILDSKLNCLKHYEVKYLYHSLFSRIEMDFNEKINNEEINEELIDSLVRKIPELVTPPVSFNNSNHFTCFIATKSKDLSTSKERMNEIKKSLGKSGFENIK